MHHYIVISLKFAMDLSAHFYRHYKQQQSGYGIGHDDMHFFYLPRQPQRGFGDPLTCQFGLGIGHLFSALYKFVRPVLLSAGNALKKQAFKTGKAFVSDLGKEPIGDLIKKHGKNATHELREKINEKFGSMDGNGLMGYSEMPEPLSFINRKQNIKKIKTSRKLQFETASRSANIKKGKKKIIKRRKYTKKNNSKKVRDIFSEV